MHISGIQVEFVFWLGKKLEQFD
jgi:hypothetical protein